MNLNLIRYFAIVFLLQLAYSCNNKQTNQRIPDSTKIAFDDIEFGMTSKELLQRKIFENAHKNYGYNGDVRVGNSISLLYKVDKTNFPHVENDSKDIIVPMYIIKNDIVSYTSVKEIGGFEYNVGASFYKDKLFNFFIYIPIDEGVSSEMLLENIVSFISAKYGEPHKFRESYMTGATIKQVNEQFSYLEVYPEGCLHEWRTKYKNIRVYEVTNKAGKNESVTFSENERPCINRWYAVEIYNDSSLNYIVKNCQYILNKILDKKNLKKKDLGKYVKSNPF